MGRSLDAAPLAVGRLVVVPFTAALLLVWWLVGDTSAVGGDTAIVRFPFAERNASALGVVGAIAALAAIAGVVVHPPDERARAAGTAAIAAAAGAAAGVGARIVTARVYGANIGGGLLVMFGPFPIAAMLLVAAQRARSSSTRPVR